MPISRRSQSARPARDTVGETGHRVEHAMIAVEQDPVAEPHWEVHLDFIVAGGGTENPVR